MTKLAKKYTPAKIIYNAIILADVHCPVLQTSLVISPIPLSDFEHEDRKSVV